MLNLPPILLQAGQQAQGGNAAKPSFIEALAPLLPIFLLFVVMYMIMIRPQKKKERERKQMLGAVKKGDRVVTVGGLHGTIKNIKDDDIILVIDEQKDVRIKVTRGAVSHVVDHTES